MYRITNSSKLFVLISIVSILITFSCNRDYSNVTVEGFVFEKETGTKLENIEIHFDSAFYEGATFI